MTSDTRTDLASYREKPIDEGRLDKADITFPSGYGGASTEVKAFLASPRTDKKHGGVLVVHEIFGLTDHIRSVAVRLAQHGFTALAPDLFTREGAPPPMSGGFGPIGAFAAKVPDAQILGDLDAAGKYLRGRPAGNGKVGVIGFCWGGRISMLYDAHAKQLDAAVAYYGRVSGDPTPNQPKYPIDVVEQMRAPLLGNFGADDQSIPPAEANKLRDALKAHHKTAEIYVYEGAGHAFNNDTRDSYRPQAAHLAFDRTLHWLDKCLK